MVGAPDVGQGRVVVGEDDIRGHLLAGATREDGGILEDGVRLQAVAAGLVEQHSPGAVGDDHREGAGGGGPGVQHGQGLPGSHGSQFGRVEAVEELVAAEQPGAS